MAAEWNEPNPAQVLPLRTARDWRRLREMYPTLEGRPQRPLDRCFEVARLAGARTAVIETAYRDRDYRSDFAAHHVRSNIGFADTTHRAHFFRGSVRAGDLWQLPEDAGYVGYAVLRPREVARVGRTMLEPPLAMGADVRVLELDHVDVFGNGLSVRGAPFMAQDREFLRCAHVDAWMCHYAAHLRHDIGRRESAWFALNAQPGVGRPVPSPGLDLYQLSELLRSVGLPPVFHEIERLPEASRALTLHWVKDPVPPPQTPDLHPGFWDYRILRTCCRYLNSGLPVIVSTQSHVFVLVGYTRERRDGLPDWINLIRHDDEVGPYLYVGDIFEDPERYSPWEWIIAPLPARIWLSGDLAEYMAGRILEQRSSSWSKATPKTREVSTLIATGQLSLHSYVQRSSLYKEKLIERRVDSALVREYRLARMPLYVWVVEAVDRGRRSRGEPPVVGEVILDATSTDMDPALVAVHLPGLARIYRSGSPARSILVSARSYDSGGVGPP